MPGEWKGAGSKAVNRPLASHLHHGGRILQPASGAAFLTRTHPKTGPGKDREPAARICSEHREDARFSVSHLQPCCCVQKATATHNMEGGPQYPRLHHLLQAVGKQELYKMQTDGHNFPPHLRLGKHFHPRRPIKNTLTYIWNPWKNDDFTWIPLKKSRRLLKKHLLPLELKCLWLLEGTIHKSLPGNLRQTLTCLGLSWGLCMEGFLSNVWLLPPSALILPMM